jgi:uncharacterized protein with ParB-like and HNH nuclease domain/arsenate reductase-like glutaredoxin family protein
MLNRASIPWNGKTLHNQMSKGNLVFDNPIQRGLVWDKKKQSLLIDTILHNYLIPAFVFLKLGNGKYDCLDGKQRSHAIFNFIEGNYKLQLESGCVVSYSWYNKETEEYEDKEFDCNGKSFDELPESAQDQIKDYSLTIAYYDEQITQEEIKEIFYRINNGKSLSSIELTRVKALSFDAFKRLANTKLMQNAFTDNGKARFNNETVAMQSYMMCFSDEPDFRTKVFRPYIQNVEVTEEQESLLKNAMAFLHHIFVTLNVDVDSDKKILRKLKNKTHLVSCIWLANYVQDKMTADKLGEIIKDFFGTETMTTKSEAYNQSCESGSSTDDAIRCRMEVLQKLVD